MEREELKKKIAIHKNSIIKSIMQIIIKEYYSAYDVKDYFETIFGEEFTKMRDLYNWFWDESGIKSVEEFVKKYAPVELYNYFIWEWYNHANFGYDKELLKRSSKNDEALNSNPYQEDWEKIEKSILDDWLTKIMDYKEEIEIKTLGEEYKKPKKELPEFRGIDPEDVEIINELIKFGEFKETLENNPSCAYSNYYDIWTSLPNSKEINKSKLSNIIFCLETSSNLEETILNILNNGDGLYFICAVPYIRNVKNKAFCILAFNLIFNENLNFMGFSKDDKKYLPKYSRLIKALNSGLSLQEIFNILPFTAEILKYKNIDFIQQFGFNFDYQDENGNTLIMKALMSTKENVLRAIIYEDYRKNLLALLKYDFSLALKNNEGLNTLDVAKKYCYDDKEIMETLAKIYGEAILSNEIEFHKEIALVRQKLFNDKLLKY